jgi:hypothetical protein
MANSMENIDVAAISIASAPRELIAALFDISFYLESYPDVRDARADPITHYLEIGWKEGRDPSATFSTKEYLKANPDVEQAGVCPLVEYVTSGIIINRPLRPRSSPDPIRRQFASARDAINSAVAVGDRIKPWLRSLPSPPIDSAALQRALSALAESRTIGLVVSLSHDDYATVWGGVQNCVSDEERVFREKGWAYLHLCPAQPLPVLAEPTPSEVFFVCVRVNGERIGVVSICTLARELGRATLGGMRRVLLLHHLMGFCPELIAELAEAFVPDKTIAWIHDLFTLCSNAAMLRNNVAFCGGPQPDSQACCICVYGGPERFLHLARMESLFDILKPDVLAPSETALNFWLAHSPLKYANAKVSPHGRLVMTSAFRSTDSRNGLHLRVGFAGAAVYHKGWNTFEELASRHYQDSRYSFFYFGASGAPVSRNITFVRVAVSAVQRHCMIETLIANRIDVVVNWSQCYETFCFAAYEAVAAGAFVLAPKKAGNVVPAISQEGVEQGLGLDTEHDLFELFATGEIFEVAARLRYGEFHVLPATVNYLEGLR